MDVPVNQSREVNSKEGKFNQGSKFLLKINVSGLLDQYLGETLFLPNNAVKPGNRHA